MALQKAFRGANDAGPLGPRDTGSGATVVGALPVAHLYKYQDARLQL